MARTRTKIRSIGCRRFDADWHLDSKVPESATGDPATVHSKGSKPEMNSTAQAPRESTLAERNAADKHCVFRIGNNWFSLPATAIQEITPAADLVPVPGSHGALAGICHCRSEFIPVLRLESILGKSCGNHGETLKLLVIKNASGNWALLIDDVIALESLETLIYPEHRDHAWHAAVLGTATCRDQVVRVLDPGGVFRIAQNELCESWNSLVAPHHKSRSKTGSLT